jgi:hypothetical protein
VARWSGIALIVYSYFIASPVVLVAVGGGPHGAAVLRPTVGPAVAPARGIACSPLCKRVATGVPSAAIGPCMRASRGPGPDRMFGDASAMAGARAATRGGSA